MRYGNEEFAAAHLYEKLILNDDVETLAEWSNRFLEGEAAVTRRQIAKGQAVYVGSYLTEELAGKLTDHVIAEAGVSSLLPQVPEGIELCERFAGDGRRLLFILNTTADTVSVDIGDGGHDLLSGKDCRQTLELTAYEVAVIK